MAALRKMVDAGRCSGVSQSTPGSCGRRLPALSRFWAALAAPARCRPAAIMALQSEQSCGRLLTAMREHPASTHKASPIAAVTPVPDGVVSTCGCSQRGGQRFAADLGGQTTMDMVSSPIREGVDRSGGFAARVHCPIYGQSVLAIASSASLSTRSLMGRAREHCG
jgi:hypothetical protein